MVALALRDYQVDACAAVRAEWAGGIRRLIVQLPTGAGKTAMASTLVAERVAQGQRALWLAHRSELLDQATQALGLQCPPLTSIGRVMASADECEATVVVASVQTLWRPRRMARLLAAGSFGLVVTDEAHHYVSAANREMLGALGCWQEGGPDVLGLTATIDRLDDIDLGHVYETVAYRQTVADAIDGGWLRPPRIRQVATDVDLDRVSVVAGEWSTAELDDEIMRAGVPDALVAAYQQWAPDRRKVLAFTPRVRSAAAVAAAFRAAGIPAEHVHGGTPVDERAAILARHRTGETIVLANVLVCAEGYDDPAIDAILWARPTGSRALVQQAIGRGLRRYPGLVDCLILDVVGTSSHHRLVGPGEIWPPSMAEAAEELLHSLLADGRKRRTAEIVRLSEAQGIPRAALNLVWRQCRVVVELIGGEKWCHIPVGDDERTGDGTGVAPYVGPALLTASQVGGAVAAVDMMDLSRYAWISVMGRWILPGGIELRPTDEDHWSVWVDGVEHEGGIGLLLAMGVAEDHAVRLRRDILADRQAPWRAAPPTAKQAAILARAGQPIPPTKGEASDAISALFADGKRR